MGYQKLHRWITKIINAGKQLKVWRQTGQRDVEETSLKCWIDYMAWINHPLSIPAVKAFAYEQLLKKVTAQTGLTRRQIPVITGSGT